MSDPSTSLFDDPNASHPLDLLINAISGSGGEYQIPPEAREGEFNLEQLLNSGAHDEVVDKVKRKREDEEAGLESRQAKIAKTVTSHIIEATNVRPELTSSRQRYTPSTFSTVEVWHPKSGQKSYGKERRMLNPPPILRVTGPLLPALTKATVQTTFFPEHSETPSSLTSQTQRIPLTYQPPTSTPQGAGMKSKRLEKEEKKMRLREQASRYGFGQTLPFERRKMAEKERQALEEGLSFPGLWVAEGIGRVKEFRLELNLGFPRDESSDAMAPLGGVPVTTLPSSFHPTLQPISGSSAQETASADSDRQLAEQAVSSDLFPGNHALDDGVQGVLGRDVQQSVQHVQQDMSTAPRQDDSEESPNIPLPASVDSRSWATFTSVPLSVVSKPSQKTVKARSMASCFTVDDSFSLWVRIHGQTVRTKYMKVDASGDEPDLTTRTGQWTPFRFQVTERAVAPEPSERTSTGRKRGNGQPANILTYGSVGCLVDLQSDIRTEPMRLVKIEKNEHLVGTDYGHPVSDLQRVGFVRLVEGLDDYSGGGRWYLSAPGARMGGAEATSAPSDQAGDLKTAEAKVGDANPQTLDSVPDSSALPACDTAVKQRKKKTKRFALAEAVIAEDAGGAEFALTWTKANRYEADRTRISGKERISRLELCEKVEDWMCWTLGGVESFSYSFFDGSQGTGTESLPTSAIDPIPQTLLPPVFRPESNTLELTLSDYFTSEAQGRTEQYDIFLGPLGPLSTATYRSMAPVNAGIDDGIAQHFEAVPYFDVTPDQPVRSVRSEFPCNRPHVIVVIDMPRAEEIIRTMQECYAEAQYQATSTLHTVGSGDPTEAEGWLTTHDPTSATATAAATTNTNMQQHDLADQMGQIDQPQTETDISGHTASGNQPFSAADLGQGDLGLEQMLNASTQQVGDQHDVDDIAAVLAAHASDTDFSLSQIDDAFLTANLDPTLHDSQAPPSDTVIQQVEGATTAISNDEGAIDSGTALTVVNATVNETTVPPLRLSRPQQEDKKVEMVPLPVLLIRKTDGVGFGVGRNVVAERVDSKAPGEKPRWGESSASEGIKCG